MTGTNDRPIGMFDSGFGGLTVARAVIDVLPKESLVQYSVSRRVQRIGRCVTRTCCERG